MGADSRRAGAPAGEAGPGERAAKVSTKGLDFFPVTEFRRCSRPGCGRPAVATLTYAHSESTAVVGPLAAQRDPHSWDLCERHARSITAPLGWQLVRYDLPSQDAPSDDDLTALAETVREAGRHATGLVLRDEPDHGWREQAPRRHPSRGASAGATRPGARGTGRGAARGATRRAHLHVVPDPGEDEPGR